jgi:hypothetical protein
MRGIKRIACKKHAGRGWVAVWPIYKIYKNYMRNAESGKRNAECGMRNAECGMRNAENRG